MICKKLLFFFLVIESFVNGAKILGIFNMPGTSHYILGSKLMRILAEAGHDITMVTPYLMKDPPKNGTYRDILLDGLADEYQRTLKHVNLLEMYSRSTISTITVVMDVIGKEAINTLTHPKMKNLVESGEKFDVILMEEYYNDAMKYYANIFDCPLIVLNSMGPNLWSNPVVGNPTPVSYVANLNLPLKKFGEMSFTERLTNLFNNGLHEYFKYTYHFKQQEVALKKLYPDSPPVVDIYNNVSLMFVNSHLSYYNAMPMVPNMVEIGGYFIDPPKELPKDLKKFLDDAKDGVVYFSMGTNLRSKDLPADKKEILLKVLGKLKQKVLWKFEEEFEDLPKNVMIMKWCPQQDILAHPNVKLFITHGGLLSTTEAIYHGVPLLAIPVFADQPTNARLAEAGGYALNLPYSDKQFTEARLSYLINELLTNPKYRDNIKERSSIYHDRPISIKETIVYWVEYVIRHRGAPHLRVAGTQLPWYKYHMVDVYAFLVAVVVIFISIVKLVLRKLFRKVQKVKLH